MTDDCPTTTTPIEEARIECAHCGKPLPTGRRAAWLPSLSRWLHMACVDRDATVPIGTRAFRRYPSLLRGDA